MITFWIAGRCKHFTRVLAFIVATLATTSTAQAEPTDFKGSFGVYFGVHSWSNPLSPPDFTDDYMAAFTASASLWEFQDFPVRLELDGVIDFRFGQHETNTEIGFNPLVVRWTHFPWNDTVRTSVRVAPVGFSYLANESVLEDNGSGSSKFNYFVFFELALSSPDEPSVELFFRQHHRCNFFDLMDDKDSNGSDYYAIGVRKYF